MIWTFFVDLDSSPPGGACPGSITVGLVITSDEHMGRSIAASGQLLRRPPVNGHHIATQDVSTVNQPGQDTGHPLHGAGRHQANSKGTAGKGVLIGLTATVTATAATSGKHPRPATAHNSHTICANWGYVRPENLSWLI